MNSDSLTPLEHEVHNLIVGKCCHCKDCGVKTTKAVVAKISEVKPQKVRTIMHIIRDAEDSSLAGKREETMKFVSELGSVRVASAYYRFLTLIGNMLCAEFPCADIEALIKIATEYDQKRLFKFVLKTVFEDVDSGDTIYIYPMMDCGHVSKHTLKFILQSSNLMRLCILYEEHRKDIPDRYWLEYLSTQIYDAPTHEKIHGKPKVEDLTMRFACALYMETKFSLPNTKSGEIAALLISMK